jgi:hypothetical protein
LQQQQQQQRRPRLDGVKTHKAWLAKQAAGVANTDTHAGERKRGPDTFRLFSQDGK